jgi:hypothetical protein
MPQPTTLPRASLYFLSERKWIWRRCKDKWRGEGVCRIRINQELGELREIPDLSAKRKWLENVIRMNETRDVRKMFESKPEGKPALIKWDLWWTNWYWGRFSPSTSVSPANLHSTEFSIIIISGRRVEGTQFGLPPPPPTLGTGGGG